MDVTQYHNMCRIQVKHPRSIRSNGQYTTCAEWQHAVYRHTVCDWAEVTPSMDTTLTFGAPLKEKLKKLKGRSRPYNSTQTKLSLLMRIAIYINKLIYGG